MAETGSGKIRNGFQSDERSDKQRMEQLQIQIHELNGTGGNRQKETFLGPELDNAASRPVFHLQEHHLLSYL